MKSWPAKFRMSFVVCVLSILAAGSWAQSVAEEPAEPSAEQHTSLREAVRAINKNAAGHFVKHDPLTEQQVLDAIEQFERPKELSDEQFKVLKGIVKNRRLPKTVTLRHFVRYDQYSFMQHGFWVKLLLERDGSGPYALSVRKQVVFSRPYTQRERQFRDSVRQSGGMPLLGRLVTYFEVEPKFNMSPPHSVNYDELVAAARAAIKGRSAEDFLKLFHWKGVGNRTRTFIENEVKGIVNRDFQIITVEKKRFLGELAQWQTFTRYGRNLPVEAYIDFIYAKRVKPEPVSLRLEVGEHEGKPRFVCHVVKEDNTSNYLGKKLSGSASGGGGHATLLPGGWYETSSTIEAPDELRPLRQANFEIWRFPLSSAHTRL